MGTGGSSDLRSSENTKCGQPGTSRCSYTTESAIGALLARLGPGIRREVRDDNSLIKRRSQAEISQLARTRKE